MREFFKGSRPRILAAVLVLVIVLSAVSGAIGKWMDPQATLVSAVVTPVQRLTTLAADGISDLVLTYQRSENLSSENEKLRRQVQELTEQLIDFQEYQRENEYLKQFLEIKQRHEDYSFMNATVISVDSADGYRSFTVDRGTTDGVALHDPVITTQGLLGYVSQVKVTSCVVTTVLDPSISIGAYCARTGDYGVVSGAANLAAGGECRLDYLVPGTKLSPGDYVVTSGLGGIFPEGLVIGSVKSVARDPATIASYAVIASCVDLSTVREVMILTAFAGQQEAVQ